MQRGYIRQWEPDAPPNDNRSIYTFCELAKDAAYWPLRELAEAECQFLNRGVTIPPGGIFVCRNFQVEEESEGHFVIFGEAPFDLLKGDAAGR